MLRRGLVVQSVVAIICSAGEYRQTGAEESFNLPKSVSENIIQSIHSETNNNFIVVYDSRTKCPKYVVEKLTRQTFVEKGTEDKKRPPFHIESTITNNSFKIHPKEYTDNSWYDRGHMAASANYPNSKELRQASFSMANICPQASDLNKGFWARFEAWIRHMLISSQFEECIVVTGPVYAPLFIGHEWVHVSRTIGTFPRLIHVPTHFFKVIIARKKNNSGGKAVFCVGAFMVPNANSVSSKTPLSNFIVRLDQLEGIVGHRAWESYLTDKEQIRLDEVVPDERDLAVTLSAKNILSNGNGDSLPLVNKSSGDSKGAVGWKDIVNPIDATSPDVVYINSRYTPIAQLTSKQVAAAAASSGLKKNKQSSYLREDGSGSVMMHLCECVDCNKPLFSKN